MSRPNFNRPHWSYSQLSQFLRCPLQYYFERIAKLPKQFTPSNLALGVAVHEALALYHRQLMNNAAFNRAEIVDGALSAWNRIEEERPVQLKSDESKAELLAQAEGLLDVYLREPPPSHVLAVEQALLVPIQNSNGDVLEKPLVAIVDLLSRDDGGLLVNEFKTAAKRMSQTDVDASLQATGYVMAMSARHGEPTSVRYTVLVKTKQPAIQQLATRRGPHDFGRLGDIVQTVERAIESEAFYPIESPINCSSCPFRRECRDWRSPGRVSESVCTTEELAAC